VVVGGRAASVQEFAFGKLLLETPTTKLYVACDQGFVPVSPIYDPT
jgi:hypothetical protein